MLIILYIGYIVVLLDLINIVKFSNKIILKAPVTVDDGCPSDINVKQVILCNNRNRTSSIAVVT